MPASNVYTFRSGGTVFCGYSEKLSYVLLLSTASLNEYSSTTNCTPYNHQSTNLSAPDVDNLNNLNVGTFELAGHENYKRFFQ